MRLTNPVVFGLVSLVCSINATKANGKPVLAKRQAMVTVTHNGCTAICVDYGHDLGTECDVLCDEASSTKEPATSAYTFPHTLTSTLRATATLKSKTPLNQSTVVPTSNDACSETCSVNDAGGFECYITCDRGFMTMMPAKSTHTSTSTLRATVTSNSKPPLNHSTVTSTSGRHCATACSRDFTEDHWDCYTQCGTGEITMTPPTKSIHTSTSTLRAKVTSKSKPPLNHSTVASTSNNACHQTCSVNAAEGDIDCYFTCDVGFSKRMLPTPTSDAALHQRTVVSATQDDCTAVCWDLMPGTECDVQCSSEFKTDMPVLRKAAHIASVEAREILQARQAPASDLLSRASAAISAVQSASSQSIAQVSATTTTTTALATALETTTEVAIASETTTEVAIASETTTEVAIASETTTEVAIASETTTEVATASETTTEVAIASETTTEVATASETTTEVAVASETTTEVATASETTTDLATASKTTTIMATASETTTEVATESETTTTSVKPSKTTTESSTSTETTTETSTSSTTITKSSTATETTTESTTSTTSSWSQYGTSFPLVNAAIQYSASTGLGLSFLVGLAAKILFLI